MRCPSAQYRVQAPQWDRNVLLKSPVIINNNNSNHHHKSLDSRHTTPDGESIWKKLQRLCRKDLSLPWVQELKSPAVGSKDFLDLINNYKMLFSPMQAPLNFLLRVSGGGMSLHEGAAVASLPVAAPRQGSQPRHRTGDRGSSQDTAGQAGEAHGYPASP